MKNRANKVIDDFSAEFLEEISDDVLRQNNVTPIKNNQNSELLKNLEETNGDDYVGVIEIPQMDNGDEQMSDGEQDTARHSFIEKADIRLSDFIAKFLDKAARPVIIICDDKVEYINPVFAALLEMDEDAVIGRNFLDFVSKDDWNLLAENIGVMLTDAKSVNVRLISKNMKIVNVTLEAMYVPDDNHFAFVLLGNGSQQLSEAKTSQSPLSVELFDTVTGLPSFYLFEDRVRVAVNHETYKAKDKQKNMVAVAAVSIDNIFNLRQIGLEEFVLKNIASKLAFSMNKAYTIARGIKIQFWFLLTDLNDVADLETELKKIKEIFDEGIDDNFAHHNLNASIGVSVFPVVARSGKKLLDQTISAVKTAQNNGGGIVYYNDESIS